MELKIIRSTASFLLTFIFFRLAVLNRQLWYMMMIPFQTARSKKWRFLLGQDPLLPASLQKSTDVSAVFLDRFLCPSRVLYISAL